MKRICILVAALAIGMTVSAQMTYHLVYIPGINEHQFGVSLAPTICSQHLNVSAQWKDAVTGNRVSQLADGQLANQIGVGAGLFYGYETVNRTINWGNYTSLLYSATPFSGTATITRNGASETHDFSYVSHRIQLQINPFLSYRINDQFSISAGVSMNLAPRLSSKVKMDGQALPKTASASDESWLGDLITCIYFDANAGVKYWFSDDMYIGLRAHYPFLNILDIFKSDDDESDDTLNSANGVIRWNLDEQTANSTILPVKAIQAVFSFGYVW